MTRPTNTEFAPYYGNYINLVPEGDIVEILLDQVAYFRGVLDGIAESDACVLHEPYTWTIKQAVGHMIDVERVFAYRALHWACADERPLTGMEQNDWVEATDWQSPTLAQLAEELELCRRSNVCMFRRLTDDAWSRGGEADGNFMSVRGAAYCLAGHILHHTGIVKARTSS